MYICIFFICVAQRRPVTSGDPRGKYPLCTNSAHILHTLLKDIGDNGFAMENHVRIALTSGMHLVCDKTFVKRSARLEPVVS